ncbi:transmembrane emp24 domain-containing protein p24delta9-like [Abrus precatorius]|uniref:Transmembrane emp24 domain-containing protein p24delta9-like n=1 Tax=Abrus precatorius TaxID=3816 RepID=A0A8B8KY64_ABRPR|nr:transmembrane emp24 domain-containing protein p24delta9-like [Abrus precatorius]
MSNWMVLHLVIGHALLCCFVNSMEFELKPGHPKCISEDIKSKVITVGEYRVVNPNQGNPIPHSHKITVRVRSPYGNSYHYEDHVYTGNFAFTAAETGDYTACFSVPSDPNPALVVTVDFVWRTGIVAKDWSKFAKKGQIEVMELELKKLYDLITLIHDEMFYLREREEEMEDLNTETSMQILTFSFLSILVCLSVAGLQLWHLKIFFEKKKLL